MQTKSKINHVKIENTNGFFTYKLNAVLNGGSVEKSPNFIKTFNVDNSDSIDSLIKTQKIDRGYCVNDRIFCISNKKLYELKDVSTTVNGVTTTAKHYRQALSKQFTYNLPHLVPVVINGQDDIFVIEDKGAYNSECVKLSNNTTTTIPNGDSFIFYNDRLFIADQNKILFSSHYNLTDFTLVASSGGEFFVGNSFGDFVKFNIIEENLYALYTNGLVIIDMRGEKDEYTAKPFFVSYFNCEKQSAVAVKNAIVFCDGVKIYIVNKNGIKAICSIVDCIGEDILYNNESLKYILKEKNNSTLKEAFVIDKTYFMPIAFGDNTFIFSLSLKDIIDSTFPKDKSGKISVDNSIKEYKNNGYLIDGDVFLGEDCVAFNKEGSTYKYTNGERELKVSTTTDLGEYRQKKICSFSYTARGVGSVYFGAKGEGKTFSLEQDTSLLPLNFTAKELKMEIKSTDKHFRVYNMQIGYI